MRTLSKNVIRYGANEPLPEFRTLTTGVLRASFTEGVLRSILCRGYEVIRGIYVAVRDEDWNTVPGKLSDIEIEESGERFSIRFVCDHQVGDAHFSWKGTINGTADGTLVFKMDGTAHSSFRKNRIGFCLLHPMELAGTPVHVHTVDGQVDGVFPELISPHQPFPPMSGMQYSIGDDVSVEISFEGDLFEMEDQRNWTDASYKTYCTPLGLPFPVEIREGQRIQQRIVVKTTTQDADFQATNFTHGELRVTVGSSAIPSVPKIGFGCTVPGNSNESNDTIISDAALDYLKELSPSFLRVCLDVTVGLTEWMPILDEAISRAQILGTTLHGEVLTNHSGNGLDELMQYLGSNGQIVSYLFVFDGKTHLASSELLQTAKSLAAKYSLAVRIGGGTRAFFTELNRAPLPVPHMDFIGYTLNPQVHAFDNQSLIETLPVQAETVKSARQKIGSQIELEVGPITFKMHVNPNATSDDTSIAFEDTVDVRQKSLFGAAWTVGSLQYLTDSDVDFIAYYEITGPRGLMDGQGEVFPLYHVFRDIADAVEIRPVQVSDKMAVAAVALETSNQSRLLVANLKPEKVTLEATFPNVRNVGTVSVRYLDETTFKEAVETPQTYRSRELAVASDGGGVRLELLPYAVATVVYKWGNCHT